MDIFLVREALSVTLSLQTLHPQYKVAKTWAIPRRIAAANPKTTASWLGSWHSETLRFK